MADDHPFGHPENDARHGANGGRGAFRRSPLAKLLALGVVVVLVVGGVLSWRYFSVRESTDDAQVDGHIYPVSARVGGTVVKVLVDDNQYVAAGTVLVELDTNDYRVALDRARADLAESAATLRVSQTQVPITSATSESRLSAAQAGVGVASAGVSAAEKGVDAARAHLVAAEAKVRENRANSERAARDLERMKALVAKEEISRQQYDAAVAAAESFRAQVDSAEAQVKEAQGGVQVAESQLGQQKAMLERARAEMDATRTGPGTGRRQPGSRRIVSRQGPTVASRRRAGHAQPAIHNHTSTRQRRGEPAERRGRAGHTAGPAIARRRPARRHLDHGEFQRRPAPEDASGAASDRLGRRVSGPKIRRARRQHRRRDGRSLQPAAARERHRELREGGAAGAGEDCARQRARITTTCCGRACRLSRRCARTRREVCFES